MFAVAGDDDELVLPAAGAEVSTTATVEAICSVSVDVRVPLLMAFVKQPLHMQLSV